MILVEPGYHHLKYSVVYKQAEDSGIEDFQIPDIDYCLVDIVVEHTVADCTVVVLVVVEHLDLLELNSQQNHKLPQ